MASTTVNEDTSIEGRLISRSDIRVDGRVDGEIQCESLDIGESAKVSGVVRAKEIVVRGTVEGDIYGDKVSLEATSRVQGDIEHQSLALEQGAEFEGSSRRSTGPATSPETSFQLPPKASGDGFAETFFPNIELYAENFDPVPARKIVEYLGKGVLSQRDASFVSCSDQAELDRVRENFCKKKLGLDLSDDEIDNILADVCKTMSAERNKSRVTFYYLTAEKTGKLETFSD